VLTRQLIERRACARESTFLVLRRDVVVDSNLDWRGEEGSGAWFNSYPEVVDFTLPQAPGGSGG
jgi:hypothetical protein